MSEVVCIKSFTTPEEAKMAKDYLNTNDVEAEIIYQGFGRAAMPFALPALGGIKLMVKEEDKETAENLLKQIEENS